MRQVNRLSYGAGIIIVAILTLAFGLWNSATHHVNGILILSKIPGVLPSHRLVKDLSSADHDLVRESLGILRRRQDPAGLEDARLLLESSDRYIWLNASLYLGSFSRSESVPYLIKALQGGPETAIPLCSAYLSSMTGKNFGRDYVRWREWWFLTHPSSNFDFGNGFIGGIDSERRG